MTRKSHSLIIGAILLLVLENCRDKETSLEVVCAVLETVIGTARVRIVKEFMRIARTRCHRSPPLIYKVIWVRGRYMASDVLSEV